MRVKVDATRCQGHTLCAQHAPEVFELDDEEGHSHVIVSDVPEALKAKVMRAVATCPEQAISVDETDD